MEDDGSEDLETTKKKSWLLVIIRWWRDCCYLRRPVQNCHYCDPLDYSSAMQCNVHTNIIYILQFDGKYHGSDHRRACSFEYHHHHLITRYLHLTRRGVIISEVYDPRNQVLIVHELGSVCPVRSSRYLGDSITFLTMSQSSVLRVSSTLQQHPVH